MEATLFQIAFFISVIYGTYLHRRAKRLAKTLKELNEKALNRQKESLRNSTGGIGCAINNKNIFPNNKNQ